MKEFMHWVQKRIILKLELSAALNHSCSYLKVPKQRRWLVQVDKETDMQMLWLPMQILI